MSARAAHPRWCIVARNEIKKMERGLDTPAIVVLAAVNLREVILTYVRSGAWPFCDCAIAAVQQRDDVATIPYVQTLLQTMCTISAARCPCYGRFGTTRMTSLH